jgi:hypothetical protein
MKTLMAYDLMRGHQALRFLVPEIKVVSCVDREDPSFSFVDLTKATNIIISQPLAVLSLKNCRVFV